MRTSGFSSFLFVFAKFMPCKDAYLRQS